jgi:hypothetical protein
MDEDETAVAHLYGNVSTTSGVKFFSRGEYIAPLGGSGSMGTDREEHCAAYTGNARFDRRNLGQG